MVLVGDFNTPLDDDEDKAESLTNLIREEWAVLAPDTQTWHGPTQRKLLDGGLVSHEAFLW